MSVPDLSPRPTIPAGKADPEGFMRMVDADLELFREALFSCPNVEHLAFAGTVTKKRYMTRFLNESGPAHGLTITAESNLRAKKPAFCKAFRLTISRASNEHRMIPAFYCSVSPGARKPEQLVARVREHWDQYLEFVQNGIQERAEKN